MLNLYDILTNILSESVTPNEVNAAIDDKVQVIINYSDEENRAPKKRLIEPYAYGMTKSGNAVLRAYQYDGDTFRGKPKWKMFRLDRIQSWQPTEQHFNASPKERGWQAEYYNEEGDRSMTTVFNQVKFDYDQTSGNPYTKGSNLYNIRKKTDNIKQSKPIKVDQMQDNKLGPVMPTTTNQTQTAQSQNDFQKMLKRNLEITQKEKEKRGFSLSKNQNPRGPITEPNNKNNELNNIENGSK